MRTDDPVLRHSIDLRLCQLPIKGRRHHLPQNPKPRIPVEIPEIQCDERHPRRRRSNSLNHAPDRHDLLRPSARNATVTRQQAWQPRQWRGPLEPRVIKHRRRHESLAPQIGQEHILSADVESSHPWKQKIAHGLHRVQLVQRDWLGPKSRVQTPVERRCKRGLVFVGEGNGLENA